MAALPKFVAREVAQGVADLLTAQKFSQNFVATREWIAVDEIEDLERFKIQVVPDETIEVTRASRGTNKHAFAIAVTVQKRLTAKNDAGDIAPVKATDAAADFAQELEDFLLDVQAATIATADSHATPLQATIEWNRERLETQGVFAVNIAVTYQLFR